MNKYHKYCPNVFLAETDEPKEKGDVIEITTKYGKLNEHVVHNLIREVNGKYYYSITRLDGFNSQERAKNRAEKLEKYASNASAKSDEYYEKSREHHEFLRMAEPIKVGHHSEKRHRAIIEKSIRNADKMLEQDRKAKVYTDRIGYWESKACEINLSMPEIC